MGISRIAVLGAGESGAGAAFLAKQKGYEVFVSDNNRINEKYKNVLLQAEIAFEEGRHTEKRILQSEEVIKSPGIPENHPMVLKLKKQGIPVISEIEFASRYTKAHKTCITGSNGKTTTTLLTYHILKNAGLNVGLAGNVGKSFAWQVAHHDFEYYVLEISSFQLDGMYDFRAETAVILNITPDHLDRYAYNFQNYADSKFRICQNQRKRDSFIYCIDDEVIIRGIKDRRILSNHFPFSIRKTILGEGAWLQENEIIINIESNPMQMTLEALALQGKHNIYNSMAAGIAARTLEIKKESIKDSLSDFQNIEHRLESAGNIHGIEFINDSKATNVNSTWYALESMTKPVIWIVGGIDKGNEYAMLEEMVRTKVKVLICLGLDNHKIIEAFYGKVPKLLESTTMEEAVGMAYENGKTGDVVLLSPACASFDLFKNYEERGQLFKESVRRL
ncbi:MAG: UDP-N-acetylmuramoyl-L-alanine--D-glutamate ligase [Bacteroidota bacterium]